MRLNSHGVREAGEGEIPHPHRGDETREPELAVHPLGWLVALFVVAQFPYRIWALKTRAAAPLGEQTPWIITGTLFALLLAVWLARLAL